MSQSFVCQKCTEEEGDFEPKDHSSFVIFLMCFVASLAAAFILLLRTDYRRRRANLEREREDEATQAGDPYVYPEEGDGVKAEEGALGYLDKYDEGR